MHAYAADDPVFRAMNARAPARDQRRARRLLRQVPRADGGARRRSPPTGSTWTTLPQQLQGRDLLLLPRRSSRSTATHNNPLALANDDSAVRSVLRSGAGHAAQGRLLALARRRDAGSASMCGSCHDIQNLQGAHVERTFEEWQGTLFATPPNGQGCAACHMNARDGRRLGGVDEGAHAARRTAFPASTWRSRPFPETDTQQRAGAGAARHRCCSRRSATTG